MSAFPMGFKTSCYYSSKEKSLNIVISEVKGGSEASLSGKLEQSPVSGIDLYVVLDEKEHEYTITCEEEDIRFAVNAPLSKHEAVKIIEGIKKQDN